MSKDIQKIGQIIVILTIVAIAISFIFLVKSNKQEYVNIYFAKLSGSNEVTEAVKRPLQKDEQPLEAAMDELFKGPTADEQDNGYFTEIPAGTRLLDIKDTPKSLVVNLNDQFMSGGGSNSVVLRVKQVRDTILDIEKTKKVYLNIDGKPIEPVGGEGLEVEQPLEPQADNSTTKN